MGCWSWRAGDKERIRGSAATAGDMKDQMGGVFQQSTTNSFAEAACRWCGAMLHLRVKDDIDDYFCFTCVE